MSKVHIACPMTVRRRRAVVFRGTCGRAWITARSFHTSASESQRWLPRMPQVFTSTAVGDLVPWSVDTTGHVFPAHGGAADEPYPHVVVDRAGIEWTVREVETPQPWARRERCLVLNSRECVRRLWQYPRDWRTLDADILLELGTAD